MPTVLLLGATSDIGYAIAKEFAANKFVLQLAGRSIERLIPLQSDIQIRYGIECSIHAFDALDYQSHAEFYNSLPVKPDITICAIGYMNENEKVIASPEETMKTIHTNYTGLVSILNIIAADYSARKQGCIAGISSVAGLRGRQSNYIYGSAKAGFTAYLSGLRNKLYHKGVHVMTIMPGFVYTKMTDFREFPKMLVAKPEDVAKAVVKAVRKKKNVIYIRWFWRWIMFIILMIPEFKFKQLKL